MSVALLGTTLSCGSTGDLTTFEGFVAQCVDVEDGSFIPDASVCRTDESGEVQATSDIELARGVPFIIDSNKGQTAAVSRSGELIDVSGDEAVFLAESDSTTAYAFTRDSRLVGLNAGGELRTAGGDLLNEFEIDGVVDFESGIDVKNDEVAFTVETPSGGYAIVIGDLSSSEVREVKRSPEYIGQARWSPDGRRLSLVGPDYRSIQVIDPQGGFIASFTLFESQVSGLVNAPRWIDDDTIMFFDAVPALLEGDVRTGTVSVTKIYDLDSGIDVVPLLPVPLPT